MPPARNSSPAGRPESLFGASQEPVFQLTPDCRIAMVNRAWEQLTGHTESEVLGLECRPHGPTRAGDLSGLGGSFCPPQEALMGQPSGSRTLILPRGGARIERRVEYWPFHAASGGLTGLIGFVRPVSTSFQVPDSVSQSLRVALLDLRVRMFARHAHDSLVGQGAEHQRVLDGIDAAAATMIPTTIVGESGTGKRFVARLIHHQSARRQMPLLGYDCQAIPPEILERELFGGREQDVVANGTSRLVAPEGSTLIVGDVLRLPRDLQRRIATSLIGSSRTVRFLALSSGDLDEAVRSESMRTDFYHALSTLIIHLRPLRDRLDEIPLLAQSLLERANLRGKHARAGFEPAAIKVLTRHDWPGNLRELCEVIDAAHQHGEGPMITTDDLPASIQGQRGGAFLTSEQPVPPLPLKDRLLAFERQVIEEALVQARQNRTRAAQRLGVNRPFLYRRIKELGIVDGETPIADLVTQPESPESGVAQEP